MRWAARSCFVEGEGPQLDPIADACGWRGLRDRCRSQAVLAPVYETVRRGSRRSSCRRDGADRLLRRALDRGDLHGRRRRARRTRAPAQARWPGIATRTCFEALIDRAGARTSIAYLVAQIEAGADAVQMFDTWAGTLAPDEFRALVHRADAPDRRQACGQRHPEARIIGFPRGAGQPMLRAYVERGTGVDAIGLDRDRPRASRTTSLQPRVPVQGNLDPLALRRRRCWRSIASRRWRSWAAFGARAVHLQSRATASCRRRRSPMSSGC